MEVSAKTTVEIIQELISLQSEKLEKLSGNKTATQQQAIDNDPVIKQLMNELSQHGDAAGSTVEKTDPYYQTHDHDERQFEKAIEEIVKQVEQLPESLNQTIQLMKKN